MSLSIVNDPIYTILLAVDILWPGIKADIQWNPTLRMSKKEYGCITFPDDGSKPLIDINPRLKVITAVEILAHELAHAKAGKDNEHGEEWESAFSAIQGKYNELMQG